MAKSTIELLSALLPRLPELRDSVRKMEAEISASRRSAAAHRMLRDLCACYKIFAEWDMPSDLYKGQKIVSDPPAGVAWLEASAQLLSKTLVENGLAWPPPETLSSDLRVMYRMARRESERGGPLTPTAMRDALATVGENACQMAANWPTKNNASPRQLTDATRLAKSAPKLMAGVAVIALISEALAFPGALIDFTQDAHAIANYLTVTARLIGHDVVGTALTISAGISTQQITESLEEATKAVDEVIEAANEREASRGIGGQTICVDKNMSLDDDREIDEGLSHDDEFGMN